MLLNTYEFRKSLIDYINDYFCQWISMDPKFKNLRINADFSKLRSFKHCEFYYFPKDINLYVYDRYKTLIMLCTNRINQSMLNYI